MTDFLLELRSEEIPARMQARAREDLARLFAAELAKAGLAAGETVTYATPRRLALIARGLPQATEAVREEVKGPKASAPPQALEGFLRKTGLAREQLEERGGVLFAVTERPGRATAEVLAGAIPAVIRAFPWPKSMRWGETSLSTESLRWVRPLQGIVALFGEDVVPVEIAGVTSGAATVGHRFHHPGAITIGSAEDYVEKLRACHVIVDQDARAATIRERAAALAAEAGLGLVEDEGLVAENSGLTEWPVPLLGRFDAAFLDVPPEVIQLTARVNQKYFVCRDGAGKLANAFVCTANIEATDGGAKIVEGNCKVLAARLSDARFFYDTDLKVPLESQAEKLGKIVFHEKLGTVADKVERVAKLARWLVEEGIVKSSPLRGEGDHAQHGGGGPATSDSPADSPLHHASGAFPLPVNGEDRERLATLAERAARLCKADLVTGMVGEFPELQGLMGGYYAAAQGEPPEVAAAIRDHYKPVGQGDEVPTAPVTVAVSLADKLDTLFSFFALDLAPTGSKDPFALRRAAISSIQLIVATQIRLPLGKLLDEASDQLSDTLNRAWQKWETADFWDLFARERNYRVENLGERPWLFHADTPMMPLSESFSERQSLMEEMMQRIMRGPAAVIDFFADRLKVQQREAGVRHDLIDAVFALGGEDDLVRLLARVRALQAFVGTEDGANLLAGYKRAANILKKEGYNPSPLVGEGGARSASAEWEGEGATETASLTPPHPSAPSALPPSPTGGEGIPLSYTPEKAEAALIAALDSAEPAAADAVAAEEFEAAMAALATLRAPIDAFFDSVTVNDPDSEKRAARLALLARVRAAVHTVADFSRIEG
jgi:glycyl-tRNA synthetase beta chain